VAARDPVMRATATIQKYLQSPYTPGSLGYRARAKRLSTLLARFPEFREMRVLDIGGDVRDWKSHPDARPARLTILSNGTTMLENPEPWMTPLHADACDPDGVPAGFDLIYSNSVIEHVGGPHRRRQFAENILRAGPHCWIQTPYRFFALEPHFLFPGFQFLPLAIQGRIAKNWPLAVPYAYPEVEPFDYCLSHDLLSKTELRLLFPTAQILHERVGGFTKSLIAVR
jgi:hypothetical protein